MDAKEKELLDEIQTLHDRYEAVLVRMQVVEANMHQLQKKIRAQKEVIQKRAARKAIEDIV